MDVPMIDLTLPAGALGDEAKRGLVASLVETVARWEGMADDPRVAATVWTFLNELPPDAIGVAGQPATEPRYRVQITVAEGTLDERRTEGLIADVTREVLEAEGSPNEPAHAARVWCHLHELPDGNWGAVGKVWRLQDIAEFAGIDLAAIGPRSS
jgi:phenylpyruvate tautomerase PptA (4-oxalocrotonate tautomerase family)